MTSATVRVEKATSDLLLSPDWGLNMEICDSVNSDFGQAKDVIKAIKKRLHHKSSKVQFLTLTLLETLMKNCGDYVHQQVHEREILNEMVKIVKKKSDNQVRDKILVLIDSWQEAFGGPTGKYPQYYWAYSELKAYGVIFPERTYDDAPIITPPATYPTATDPPVMQQLPPQFPVPSPPQALYSIPSSQHPGYGIPPSSYGSPQAGYGMPSTTGSRLRGYGPHPFYGMPVNTPHPSYGMPVNTSLRLDEAMASEMTHLSLSDLESMRSVMELLNEMLRAVNPSDSEAVKDEVISDLVNQCRLNEKKLMAFINCTNDEKLLEESLHLNDKLQSLLAKHDAIASGSTLPLQTEKEDTPPTPVLTTPVAVTSTSQVSDAVAGEEEEEEDDEFAQLARRKSKMKSVSTESSTISQPSTSAVPELSTSVLSNSLSLPDPLAPVKTITNEDDMINLLSLSLAPQSSSPLTPTTPTLTSFSTNQDPSHMTSPGNSYAVSFAQPQPQETLNKTTPPTISPVNQRNSYAVSWVPPQAQPQPQESDVATSYPPPPWEMDAPTDVGSTIPESTAASSVQYTVNSASHAIRPMQQLGSVGSRPNVPGAQPKPSYVSSNTFFGDLVDLRNSDGTMRSGMTASTGSPSFSMNSGRK
ncbi:Target of Myb protein 1 [Rhynchospora pubera]|uniref:Target of Myb protein 1 n=1 Tax=Rhynchospora pubera TaxID=906938 RepID=A0AAV8ELR2_9POAL|nr:Target of Myb protein 1 [Rhynchospora pubera]